MKYALSILQVLGDCKWHFKEELYPLITLSAGKKIPYLNNIKNIDKHFNKYLSYGLIKRGKSQKIQVKGTDLEVSGHKCFNLTKKGIKALDYLRALSGAKDLQQGDLYGSDENFKHEVQKMKRRNI